MNKQNKYYDNNNIYNFKHESWNKQLKKNWCCLLFFSSYMYTCNLLIKFFFAWLKSAIFWIVVSKVDLALAILVESLSMIIFFMWILLNAVNETFQLSWLHGFRGFVLVLATIMVIVLLILLTWLAFLYPCRISN